MRAYSMKFILTASIVMLLPSFSHAQGISQDTTGLDGVLQKLFTEMLPLCKPMMDVGRALGGFGALWYISVRVWRHLSRAEAIDFYPLLRPFAIGLAIILFPAMISLLNGVLEPTVKITKSMSEHSQDAIYSHISQQEKAIKEPPATPDFSAGNNEGWDKYEQPANNNNDKGFLSGIFNFFSLKNIFKTIVTELCQICFEAVSLCINTIRTFYLIILVILGPLVLGLSVFDGFHQSLVNWFARYINIFMWLPVANIFGAIISKILENMMTLDQDFFSSTAYIIFMIIATVGYITVPSVANYIVHASGQNTLLHKVNNLSAAAAKALI